MTRLFDRMAASELAIGTFLKGGPSLVPSLARAGFDYIRPDMMFSALDWQGFDHVLRTAEALSLTTWLRLSANPWHGGGSDAHVVADAARAFSLGTPVVQVSVGSFSEAERLLAVAQDWHRSGAGEYPTSGAEYAAQQQRAADSATFVPSIESSVAIRDACKIAELPGLRIIMIACTDFASELGHPFEYEHPDVWKAIDEIVAAAHAAGVAVAANTGYAYRSDDEIRHRVEALRSHGADIVMVQGAEFLLEVATGRLVNGLRESEMCARTLDR